MRVQPGASRDELIGWLEDGTLKVRVAAPAREGMANARLERFLASVLGVPASAVAVVHGRRSRLKLVKIDGLSMDDVRRRVGG